MSKYFVNNIASHQSFSYLPTKAKLALKVSKFQKQIFSFEQKPNDFFFISALNKRINTSIVLHTP